MKPISKRNIQSIRLREFLFTAFDQSRRQIDILMADNKLVISWNNNFFVLKAFLKTIKYGFFRYGHSL